MLYNMHMISIFDHIRIVLINTTHPGNIGATARAMKTMGLKQLYLVNPYAQFPSADVTARAAGADSVLATTVVVEDLASAIGDCQLVIGSGSEERSLPLARIDARQCGELTIQTAADSQVAIVFGTERSGMTNEELALCQRQLVIPANPEYSSLNLAAAVQIVCYEIHMAAVLAEKTIINYREPYDRKATSEEMRQFYQHLEAMLIEVNFLKPGVEKKLLPRLIRLFNRADLEANEINILRGIFNAAQKKVAADEE